MKLLVKKSEDASAKVEELTKALMTEKSLSYPVAKAQVLETNKALAEEIMKPKGSVTTI